MLFANLPRFTFLLSQVRNGGTPVCFFDQDGTLTVKSGTDESAMTLHPGVIPAVKRIVAKGGVFVPSSARSMSELKQAYTEVQGLSFAANDGFLISMPGKPDIVFGESQLPDFSGFQAGLEAFTVGMDNVTVKDMGAYFGLFIDQEHPSRFACERFFAESVGKVSDASDGLLMRYAVHPMGLTMEPSFNRGKAGVIETMLPMLGVENPVLIVAGDAANDIPALRFAKDSGGFAIKVHKGGLHGVPAYANGQVADVNECVKLLTDIADAMEIRNT